MFSVLHEHDGVDVVRIADCVGRVSKAAPRFCLRPPRFHLRALRYGGQVACQRSPRCLMTDRGIITVFTRSRVALGRLLERLYAYQNKAVVRLRTDKYAYARLFGKIFFEDREKRQIVVVQRVVGSHMPKGGTHTVSVPPFTASRGKVFLQARIGWLGCVVGGSKTASPEGFRGCRTLSKTASIHLEHFNGMFTIVHKPGGC